MQWLIKNLILKVKKLFLLPIFIFTISILINLIFQWFLCESESSLAVSNSLWPQGLNSPWNSPGQNTGVGNLSLLQGIFPTQGSKPGLPHCRRILHHLSHKGSPRMLAWVACPLSGGSFWPRNRIRVSCIAAGFFTIWATREASGISLSDFFKNLEFYKFRGLEDYTRLFLLYRWRNQGQVHKLMVTGTRFQGPA